MLSKNDDPFKENSEGNSEEVVYPINFYLEPKIRTCSIHNLNYVLSNYNQECETCQELKEQAVLKNIQSILMDDEENHILKLLS